MDPVAQFVVIIAVLLLLGAFGELIFRMTGIPDVIWLVLAGILAGPVTGVVSPELLKPGIPFIGALSLVVILAGGAFKMQLSDVASAAPRALLLAVVGFVFSVLAIVAFLYVATQIGWVKQASPLTWIMCGSIVGGASSLIIMPTMAGGSVDTKVARILEVESSATDALCIVITMVMIDLLISSHAVAISQPFLALLREVGIGFGMGLLVGMALMPLIPKIHGKQHSYTIFLSVMLILYGITNSAGGNGAMAVLICGMTLGNAKAIMEKLIPSAKDYNFRPDKAANFIHEQISFIIKSFFFTLIGLMFPTDLRLVLLGAVAAIVLFLFRIPAVRLSLLGAGLNKAQTRMLDVATPRGIAAGVLSAIPLYHGIPHMEKLSAGIFSLIVFSILIFAVGFAVTKKLATTK